MEVKAEEPVEGIVSRVVYALLISASLVINLLLVIAIMRLKARVAVIYLLTAAMVIPDCIFYTKVIVELMNWDQAAPTWAEDDVSCGVWQFATHLHPLLYSYLLVAIVYHAFVALFLDTRGHYERSTRRLLPLLLVGLTVGMSLVCAPSALYSRVLPVPAPQHEQQVCHLEVPPIGSPDCAALPTSPSSSSFPLRLSSYWADAQFGGDRPRGQVNKDDGGGHFVDSHLLPHASSALSSEGDLLDLLCLA